MNKHTIFITEYDAERLSKLISTPGALEHHEPEYLEILKDELSEAEIVAPENIPSDVVTMNSTVHLVDMETEEEEVYTLVFPSDADIIRGRISILAPIGTAMFGSRTGDTFSWKVPDGERHLRVKEITYQPEASGDYNL